MSATEHLSDDQFGARMDTMQAMNERGFRASHVVREVIARSTAPLHHLEGHEIRDTPFHIYPEGAYGRRLSGTYERDKKLIKIHNDAIDHPQGVIHEVGHAYSAHLGLPHAAYDTPEHQELEEQYAHKFAEKHYRPPR